MAKIKVGIVEDEMLIAQEIASALTTFGYNVTEPAISYTEALGMIVSEQPDILLLDVQLKGSKDGIELARKVKEDYNIPFIFLTANADTATVDRAKELNPHAYLVKPFGKGELYASIEIALHNYATGNNATKVQEKPDYFIKDALFVKQGPVYHKIKIEDIIYMESSDVYVNVHSTVGKMLVRNSLQNFLELLDSKRFFRVHKSFAVNLDHVDSISADSLLIKNIEIPIGRTYKDDLMRFLELE